LSFFEYETRGRRRATALRMPMLCGLIFVSLASFSLSASEPPSSAQDTKPQPTLQKIVEQQTQLRAQVVAKRGAFKDMHDGDRDRLVKQQDRLLLLLEGHRNFDELREEERVEVFNHLQSVNAAATKAEEERQICERTRLVGTHRYEVVCMSGKEYREHRDNARKSVRTVMKCQGASAGSKACKSD
jgi:hypothetical protein